MKIVHASFDDLNAQLGNRDHILGLSHALNEIGHEVHLVTRGKAEDSDYISGANRSLRPSLTEFLSSARAGRTVAKKALKTVEQIRPDVVYLRPFPMDYLLLTRHLARAGVPYVCEINTIMDRASAAAGKAVRGKVYSFVEGRTLANAAGWFPVTNEICRYAKRASGVEKPFIIARNGVDPEKVSPKRPRAMVREGLGVAESTSVLTMLGFKHSWHGADRAISMLANLGRPAELWLIGSSGEKDKRAIEEVAKKEGVESLVRVFPWMHQEDVADLLAASDVGLGPFAIDREGLTEAQPLKVAPYLAAGIPVLVNYEDLRLSPDLPFVRSVKSNDPRVLAQQLTQLLDLPQNVREQIREFAIEKLSWRAIAMETADFLQDLLSRRSDVAVGQHHAR